MFKRRQLTGVEFINKVSKMYHRVKPEEQKLINTIVFNHEEEKENDEIEQTQVKKPPAVRWLPISDNFIIEFNEHDAWMNKYMFEFITSMADESYRVGANGGYKEVRDSIRNGGAVIKLGMTDEHIIIGPARHGEFGFKYIKLYYNNSKERAYFDTDGYNAFREWSENRVDGIWSFGINPDGIFVGEKTISDGGCSV